MILETFKTSGRRFRLTLFGLTSVLLVVLLLPICSAYADDYEGGGGGSHNIGESYPKFGIVWFDKQAVSNGVDVTPIRVRYGVVAYTNWDAAMYCLRGTSFTDSELTNVKKNKLLADSDFRVFANLFDVGKPEATNDWSGDAAIVLAWNSARELYGETYCYSVIYTMDQWYAADSALRRIMIEDDTTGGGGSGDGYHGSSITYTAYRWNSSSDGIIIGDEKYFVNKVPMTPTNFKVNLNQSVQNIIDEHSDMKVLSQINGYNNTIIIYLVDKDNFRINTREYSYSGGTNKVPSTIEAYATSYMITVTYIGADATEGDLPVYTVTDDEPRVTTYEGQHYYNLANITYFSGYEESSGGGDEPVDPDPPVTWPDPPTTTVVPPDIPNPGDPTVPTPPEPPDPWSLIPGIDIDITGDDFQDLLDALNEHCIHLQTSIQDNISQLWSLQSDLIQAQMQWLGNDVIIPSFTDLKDYLQQLFEWLAERMNFNLNYTNGAYDDSSVITWLKKIWSKMGDGINTQPTDPVTEPDDWWAWLLALMANFVSMLLSFGSDKLSVVGDALGALTSKFPFSLPWDLAALLALLDAPPQIPEWDIPCFAVSLEGLQQVGTYHITLEDYDSVWENVRWIERLSFIVLLIRSSDFFTGLMRRAVGRD